MAEEIYQEIFLIALFWTVKFFLILYKKVLQSLETCPLFNNNLLGKLVSSLEPTIQGFI